MAPMTKDTASISKNPILRFLAWDAAGGVVLILAAILAMIVANGQFADLYHAILHDTYLRVGFVEGGALEFGIEKSVLHWVNDWMMVFFFMVVGLEIKREMLIGSLNNRKKALLPILCAVGGMVIPAVIYAIINLDSPETMRGWAISCATDIAFALGILSILGKRVPATLKVLLLAIAIIDDLGAIIIIALFYTENLATNVLLFCIVPVLGMVILRMMKVTQVAPYLALGTILWAAVLESGVHATLVGVITALFIPLHAQGKPSPLLKLEHDLHPWVAFVVMPVFAFANAGVPLAGIGMNELFAPLTLGIIAGLVIGKQLGVFGTMWVAVKTGFCEMPAGVNWRQLYGVAMLCGIGFTMSLFIGGLAFPGNALLQNEVRLGVLIASLISAVSAYILLRTSSQKTT
jgi:NhaA family Na+:H+ antiporter